MNIEFKETNYGFQWGAATIERMFQMQREGWVVLNLKTPKYKSGINMYVTKSGKVRFFIGNKEVTLELKKL